MTNVYAYLEGTRGLPQVAAMSPNRASVGFDQPLSAMNEAPSAHKKECMPPNDCPTNVAQLTDPGAAQDRAGQTFKNR